MKILVFSHEFPPDQGGAGFVASTNANLFALKGHQVTVLTREQKNHVVSSGLIKEVRVRTIKRFWYASYYRAIDFADFDLVLLNDPASIIFAGMFFSGLILKKSFCFLHGTDVELLLGKNCSFIYKIMGLFYKRALFLCANIIAPSFFMKEKFLNKTAKFDDSKVLVIPHKVNIKLFYMRPAEQCLDLRLKLGIANDAFLLLSVSRVIAKKGYCEKLLAFKKLKSIYRNIHWLIVGDGVFKEELENIIKKEDIEDSVTLVGKVFHTELPLYYSSANLFWLLSKFEESFGLVYLEAAACGCSVVGSNKGGVPELMAACSGVAVDGIEQCVEYIASFIQKKLNNNDRYAIMKRAHNFVESSEIEKLTYLV